MKRILAIAKAELQVLFYSPIAWFILIAFIVQACLSYFPLLNWISDSQEYGRVVSDQTFKLFAYNPNPSFIPRMINNLFYFIPLLTMGLMSREISSGSIKLLFSSPISNTQIILGKFVSIMVYGLVMVFILFLFILHGSLFVENFDWGFIWVSLLGVYLLLCAYASIGLFMSSITSYQMIAALSTLIILTFFSYVGDWWQEVAFVRDITYWLSMDSRASTFARGMFCTEDFIYFITVISMFISLAVLRLMIRRERRSKLVVFGKYFTLFAIVVAIAFFSSRPILMGYYDATRFERNTLSKGSQEIIENLDESYTVITYVNIFDRERVAWAITPRREVWDMKELMGQYTRFMPDLKLKYVYYHSKKGEAYTGYQMAHRDKSYEELVEHVADRFNVRKGQLLTEEEVLKLEPTIADENFTTFKVAVSSSGNKGYFRYFEDNETVPSEREISAGFKRMYTTVYPKVGFVQGNGERLVTETGDLAYSSMTSKSVRSSLYNQGFDVVTLTLDEPVPSDINILIISDPRNTYSETATENYQQYVDRGGNLVVLGEPSRAKNVNPLIEQFGVQIGKGRVVKPRKGNRADIMGQIPTEDSEQISYFFETKRKSPWYKNVTPSVSPLVFDENNYEYKRTIILETDSLSGMPWLELETTNFEEEDPKFNEAAGEAYDMYFPLIVSLERKNNSKTQKIIVGGDADFMSNHWISGYLSDYAIDNGTFIMGMFEWLSDGISPVDIRRPKPTDNKLTLKHDKVGINKALFMYVLPVILAVLAIVINLRRKSK